MHCPAPQAIRCGPCNGRTAPQTHAAICVRPYVRPRMTLIAAPGALRQPSTAFDPGWEQLPAAASPLPRAQLTASSPLPPALNAAHPSGELSLCQDTGALVCGVKCLRTSLSAEQLPCMHIRSVISPTCQAVCGGITISPFLTAGQALSSSVDESQEGV